MSIFFVKLGSAYAHENVSDHSQTNYEPNNTLPTSQRFPVDIYCPEIPKVYPWSIYAGASIPIFQLPFSNVVPHAAFQEIVGMTKDLLESASGYTTLYAVLEGKTIDATATYEGVDYRYVKTNIGAGLGIQQGLWTRYFLLYLNILPGIYQSNFSASDNSVNDSSYNVYLGVTSGFRIYFVRNENFNFYTNLEMSVDFAKKNNLTLEDGSAVNPNQYALLPGVEFGIGF